MRLKASLILVLLVLALLGSLASGQVPQAPKLTEYAMLRMLPPGRLDALIGGERRRPAAHSPRVGDERVARRRLCRSCGPGRGRGRRLSGWS